MNTNIPIFSECLKCIIQAFLKVLNGIFQISQLSDTVVNFLWKNRRRCSGLIEYNSGSYLHSGVWTWQFSHLVSKTDASPMFSSTECQHVQHLSETLRTYWLPFGEGHCDLRSQGTCAHCPCGFLRVVGLCHVTSPKSKGTTHSKCVLTCLSSQMPSLS